MVLSPSQLLSLLNEGKRHDPYFKEVRTPQSMKNMKHQLFRDYFRKTLLLAVLGGLFSFLVANPSVTSFFAPLDDAMAETEKEPKIKAPPGQFVLVELFTSQGCSSCPPADALLGKLSEHAEKNQKPIFTLSYHVDYWNRLGWRDPYSQAFATRRQREYVKALDAESSYTPQMIVNGKIEFVGGDSRALTGAISDVEGDKPQILTIDWDTPFESLKYKLRGSTINKELVVVGYRPSQKNIVPRGENAGKTLAHTNVVKFMTTFPVQERGWGRKEISFPETVRSRAVRLLAFVQDIETREVVALTDFDNLN